MAPGHHHRAGSLRQANKKNKRTKASKRSIARAAGGRVDSSTSTAAGAGAASSRASALLNQSKANRRNHQQQLRDAKRQELMRRKRGGFSAATMPPPAVGSAMASTSLPPPPRVVGIISLGASLDVEEQVRECLAGAADKAVRLFSRQGTGSSIGSSIVTCKYNAHKREGHLTFLTCQSSTLPSYTAQRQSHDEGKDDDYDNGDDQRPEARDGLGHAATRETACVLAALDLARVCDVLLFVIDGHGPMLDRDVTEIRIGAAGGVGGGCSVGTTKTGSDYDHLISARGDRILAALKGQGLPTPITVLAHTAASDEGGAQNPFGDDGDDDDGDERMTYRSVKSQRRAGVKRKLELKKYVGRFATTEFGTGHDRVVELHLTQPSISAAEDNMTDTEPAAAASDGSTTSRIASPSAAALVRTLCFLSCSPPNWVSQSPRSYVLPDSVRYDPATHQLMLTGYVRGLSPLSVNSLMHVPNLGTFPIHSMAAAASAPPLSRQYQEADGSSKMDIAGETAGSGTDVPVLCSDPDRQESLNMFASPDALDGEQNLVGFDDGMNGSEENNEEEDEAPAARPAGWSDYQAAWIDAVDKNENDGNDGDDDQAAVDRGEMARELNQKAPPSATPSSAAMRGDATMATGMEVDLDDANEVNVKDRDALMEQRRKEQKENADFPDEVQVEEDQNASERFARYRSLKSFRKSYWDPKENLPETYASIFHFSNFRATQRSILNECKERIRAAERAGYFWGRTPAMPHDTDESANDAVMIDDDASDRDGSDGESNSIDDDLLSGCVPVGAYVTVTLRDVHEAPVDGAFMTAVSLLPHENKVSVLHMAVSRHNDNSEHSTSALVKSKDVVTFRCGWRTWQGRPVFSQMNLNCDKHPLERFLPVFGAASVFGPVTYTPAPVLMFVNDRVVAIGSVVSADANRLVLKRIVLTGYPVKVHKRHAVVKYMFYNPADVQWFQPAGLFTKHGLQGNILSSVGEHGTMKCLFHAPIKQHDTVCLPLYKRVFPKYVDNQDGTPTDKLVVR